MLPLIIVLSAARIRDIHGATGAENQVRLSVSLWDTCPHPPPTENFRSALKEQCYPSASSLRDKNLAWGSQMPHSVDPGPAEFIPHAQLVYCASHGIHTSPISPNDLNPSAIEAIQCSHWHYTGDHSLFVCCIQTCSVY